MQVYENIRFIVFLGRWSLRSGALRAAFSAVFEPFAVRDRILGQVSDLCVVEFREIFVVVPFPDLFSPLE